MTDLHDSFSVYSNQTNRVILTGTYQEVEDYIENPDEYTVVWNLNGQIM